MLASTGAEFYEAINGYTKMPEPEEISMATGEAAYEFIRALAGAVTKIYPQIKIHVYKIKNEFFGESVTVAGLVTGRDLARQLDGKPLGERLLLAECMLRHGGDLFLCGTSLDGLSEKLGVKITLCPNDGSGLFSKIIGD